MSKARQFFVGLKLSLAALLLLFPNTGTAQLATPVAQEILGYKTFSLTLDDDAADCKLDTAKSELSDQVQSGLADIGLKQTDASALDLNVLVKNSAFGLLNVECALYTELSFTAAIPSKNITGLDANRQRILDRMGSLPVTVWKASSFAVAARSGTTDEEADRRPTEMVKTMIDQMIELLSEQR